MALPPAPRRPLPRAARAGAGGRRESRPPALRLALAGEGAHPRSPEVAARRLRVLWSSASSHGLRRLAARPQRRILGGDRPGALGGVRRLPRPMRGRPPIPEQAKTTRVEENGAEPHPGHTRVGESDAHAQAAPVDEITKELTPDERELLGDLLAVVAEHSDDGGEQVDARRSSAPSPSPASATPTSGAARARTSSPTRSRSRRSAPACASTPRRSARRSCTTRSRTRAPASRRSRSSSASRSPSSSTASPSSPRSPSRAATSTRPRTTAR